MGLGTVARKNTETDTGWPTGYKSLLHIVVPVRLVLLATGRATVVLVCHTSYSKFVGCFSEKFITELARSMFLRSPKPE